jgi:Peptidase A4 family
MNETTSEHTYIYTPVGTTKVSGSEAEWIMERPTVGGNLRYLAHYNSAVMSSAVARTERGVYTPYEGANNVQITMVNGSDTLSTVNPIDTLSMRFDWHAFH